MGGVEWERVRWINVIENIRDRFDILLRTKHKHNNNLSLYTIRHTYLDIFDTKMSNNNSEHHNNTTHKQNHLLYFCIFIFFFFYLVNWYHWIGWHKGIVRCVLRTTYLLNNNPKRYYTLFIFFSSSIFCVSHFSISISHLFLFYFDASKFIGKAFFVSRKIIIFTWNCLLIPLPFSRSLSHAFGLQLDACMRMAFGISQCQLEWLLHNFSIHQLESMLTLVCLCIHHHQYIYSAWHRLNQNEEERKMRNEKTKDRNKFGV